VVRCAAFVFAERRTRAGLILLIVAGAGLRLWGLQFGLANPYARPDAEVMVLVALGVLKDPNPHFFDWGTLFAYVTAAMYAVFFAIERAVGGAIVDADAARSALPPVLFLIPRVFSAAAGTATIAVLFAAARELFSARTALVAAFLLTVAFLHVRDSHFGVVDVTAAFLTMCAFWAGVRCATQGPTPRRAALTGFLCGLAVSTKYNAAPILLPALVAIVASTIAGRPPNFRLAARATAMLGLFAALGFIVATPYALLDYGSFLTALANVRRHMELGHVVMTRGWEYHAKFTLRYGVGIPLFAAAMVGPCTLVVQRRWKAAAILLAFPVSYYWLVGSGKTVFVRYMVPMVPFLCLGAAVTVDWLSSQIDRMTRNARLGAVAAALGAAAIAIPTLVSSIQFDRLMTQPDTRVTAAERIIAEFPDGASVYQNGFIYARVDLPDRKRYPHYGFNGETNGFEFDGNPVAPPDVIVLLDSPVPTYTAIPLPVAALVETDYTLVTTVVAITPARTAGALYDQEDAFFVPFSGIDQARRPGPNVAIYRLRN